MHKICWSDSSKLSKGTQHICTQSWSMGISSRSCKERNTLPQISYMTHCLFYSRQSYGTILIRNNQFLQMGSPPMAIMFLKSAWDGHIPNTSPYLPSLHNCAPGSERFSYHTCLSQVIGPDAYLLIPFLLCHDPFLVSPAPNQLNILLSLAFQYCSHCLLSSRLSQLCTCWLEALLHIS